jgi:flagellin
MSTIGTNVGAVSASFYLTQNNDALSTSIRRLASGSRLAIASDDAAGVAVSGKLDARIRRLGAAAEGAANVISFAQTVDGFLKTIQDQLTRMSELAQRASNGAFGSNDLANYNTEFVRLRDQISSIAANARFNGVTLFAASTISVSINAEGNTDTFALTTTGDLTSLGLGATITIGSIADAISAVTSLNNAIQTLTTRRAEVNADVSKFNFHIANMRTEKVNVEAANGRIKDLNIAEESTALSKYNILVQASTSMLAQANATQQNVLALLQ